VPVASVAVGDKLLVRAGEVIPVDGIVDVNSAIIDESALTGESMPVARPPGSAIFGGTLNVGSSFEMTASIDCWTKYLRRHRPSRHRGTNRRAPFVRLTDRYALAFLPVTVAYERDDEGNVYPTRKAPRRQLRPLGHEPAHREILHLARLLARIVEDLPLE
jgi:cation transport ATPase